MGGGGAPKHFQFLLLNDSHIDYSREPPEIVYSGGDRPKTASPDRTPVFHK